MSVVDEPVRALDTGTRILVEASMARGVQTHYANKFLLSYLPGVGVKITFFEEQYDHTVASTSVVLSFADAKSLGDSLVKAVS